MIYHSTHVYRRYRFYRSDILTGLRVFASFYRFGHFAVFTIYASLLPLPILSFVPILPFCIFCAISCRPRFPNPNFLAPVAFRGCVLDYNSHTWKHDASPIPTNCVAHGRFSGCYIRVLIFGGSCLRMLLRGMRDAIPSRWEHRYGRQRVGTYLPKLIFSRNAKFVYV